jgi:hypothetical protein
MVDGTDGNGHRPHQLEFPATPTRNKLTDERLTAFLGLYMENEFHAVKACIASGPG